MRGAAFLGAYTTPPRYRLYDLGGYPGAIKGGIRPLDGEVYRLSRRMLIALDRFEEVPAEYVRERIRTPWGAAWIYLYRGGLRTMPPG